MGNLSEAKGRGGGRGGGRSGGRGGSSWYGSSRYGGSSYGGGDGSFHWLLICIIVGVIFGFLLCVVMPCCCVCCYFQDDKCDENYSDQQSHQSNIAIEQNQQHQQNDSDNTAIYMLHTRHQSSNQFQDNLPQNTHHSTKLSPTHLPYSIAPVDVPPPYPGNQSGTWINGSLMMTNQPSNQFQDNFPQNTNHGEILSSTHLPYPTIATVDTTPSYQSSNQFQENFPQNTNNGEILSPTHPPYSIAPVDVPPPYGSWMTNLL